jgi:hypothetical protein
LLTEKASRRLPFKGETICTERKSGGSLLTAVSGSGCCVGTRCPAWRIPLALSVTLSLWPARGSLASDWDTLAGAATYYLALLGILSDGLLHPLRGKCEWVWEGKEVLRRTGREQRTAVAWCELDTISKPEDSRGLSRGQAVISGAAEGQHKVVFLFPRVVTSGHCDQPSFLMATCLVLMWHFALWGYWPTVPLL